MGIHVLKNEKLTVYIKSYGAELQSIVTSDGKEILFQGDEGWCGISPNLYPIVGYFPENKYIFDGKEYNIAGHGVASVNQYTVESQSDDEIVFLLTENEKTLKCYPFKFEFRVKYRLVGDTIEYSQSAKNTDEKTAYCAMGMHPAFPIVQGFAGAKIVFDSEEKDYTVKNLDPEKCSVRFINEQSEMPLSEDIFESGAITYGNLKSKSVRLVRPEYDYDVRVDLGNCPNLTIYSGKEAKFMCIEPWSCESAHYCTSIALTEQVGITTLKPDESVEFHMAIGYEKRR